MNEKQVDDNQQDTSNSEEFILPDVVAANFTERETDIMQRMAQFSSNKEIAEDLTISVSTVRWYTKQIYSKLDVHSRTKAIEKIHELQTAPEETRASLVVQPEPQPRMPKKVERRYHQQILLSSGVIALVIIIFFAQNFSGNVQNTEADIAANAIIVADDLETTLRLVRACDDLLGGVVAGVFGPCIMPLVGGKAQAILEDFKYSSGGSFSWSPDGEQIVFSAIKDRQHLDQVAMFIVNADGSELIELLPDRRGGGKANPAWSPDGEWIAFHHNGKISIVHPDGTGLRVLWTSLIYPYCADQPQWSPDSTQVIFSKGRCDWFTPIKRDIMMVSLNDNTTTTIVTTEHSNDRCGVKLENIAFSPDGTQIVYQDGRCQNILRHLATGEEMTLIEFPYWWTSSVYPQWSAGVNLVEKQS